MSFKRTLCLILAVLLIVFSFYGCKANSNTESSLDINELFTDRDKDASYDESQAQFISLSDESVTIKDEGIYIISGTLSDGQIIVDSDDADKIQLVLNGVKITSSTGAAIYVKEADKVFITLADKTTNELATSGEFQADGETNIDGVIFSKSDLTLNGSGTLSLSTSYGNGIVSKDDLKITGGTYSISVSGSGLEANDIIATAGGTFNITSQNDALHCDNDVAITGGTFAISAEDDGIHTDNALYVSGGTIDILTSYEGLEGKEIHISGGDISLDSNDDGLNAAGGNDSSGSSRQGFVDEFSAQEGVIIDISGGTLYVNCSGDGIDSNGDISISGGSIVVEGPENNGNGSLDYNGSAEITGGTILAIGASGMAMNLTEANQGSILVNFNASYSNETIIISDSEGNEIYSFESSKTINSVLFSSPDLKKGETYTITLGDKYQSVTLDDYIYGSSSGMGGMR